MARAWQAPTTCDGSDGIGVSWVDRNSVHLYTDTMSTIGAAQFKQECLAILDHLGPEGIIITKHGKPVARLVPIEAESASLIGSLAAKVRIHGDLLTTGLRWDAES